MNTFEPDAGVESRGRQRRNLMALSLFLVVAQIPSEISLGSMTLHTQPPFTIALILWIVWLYWTWRYYSHAGVPHRNVFFNTYRLGLNGTAAASMFKRARKRRYAQEVDNQVAEMLGHKNGIWEPSTVAWAPEPKGWKPGKVTITNTVFTDSKRDTTRAVITQTVAVPKLRHLFYAARAWLNVFFVSELVVEQLLPWMLVIATALVGLYRLIPAVL